MNRKGIIISILLAIALGGGITFRLTQSAANGEAHAEKREAGSPEEKGAHEGHGELKVIRMTAEFRKENGVVVVPANKVRLAGVLSATGKVEANADRIAHVSPRISGKVVTVRSSLGESVASGEVLVTLDSVELGEALSRYHQSQSRLSLAQSNMDRIRALVEKKIAARKEIHQAETEYQNALTELRTDEERLSLYGASVTDLKGERHRKPLLPVRSPISGIITEKHAIVGELADPAKSLYTVADLSSVWVLVDIHEKDLAKVHPGQSATVVVGAFPELTFRGRIKHIADVMDEASRTVKARVEVANPGRRLKPQMFATVSLALPADAAAVLAVPEDAVQDLDGKKVLFTSAKGGGFVVRRIEAGRSFGGMVEIVSGLKEGEEYVVKGAFVLKSELKKGELEGDEH